MAIAALYTSNSSIADSAASGRLTGRSSIAAIEYSSSGSAVRCGAQQDSRQHSIGGELCRKAGRIAALVPGGEAEPEGQGEGDHPLHEWICRYLMEPLDGGAPAAAEFRQGAQLATAQGIGGSDRFTIPVGRDKQQRLFVAGQSAVELALTPSSSSSL